MCIAAGRESEREALQASFNGEELIGEFFFIEDLTSQFLWYVWGMKV